jgi:hypothetical protein
VASPVDEQRLRDYQSRITTWIGRQGILFQIRYIRLARGGSLRAVLIAFLLNFGAFFVLSAILAFGGLMLYQRSEVFGEKQERYLSGVLETQSLEATGFSRTSGEGSYRRLSLSGGENSFFYEGTILGLSGEMSFLEGILTDWKPEAVSIDRADFLIKAGGNRSEMEAAFSGIVKSFEGASLTRVEIDDFSCEWGYSTLTAGGIYNSRFEAVLDNGRWEIALEGGFFRQNWIGPLEIGEGVLSLDMEGIQVRSLSLTTGDGRMALSGTIGGPLELPSFDLKGRFARFPVDQLFEVEGVETNRFIEGTVSGEIAVTGSTNRRIETRGQVVLWEGDQIRIRDQWALLRAISTVEGRDGTYRRIDFESGSFDFSTSRGGCEVSNIELLDEKVARLTGGFSTSLPSQEDAARFLGIKLTEGFSKGYTDTSSAQQLENDRLSLRRATRNEDGLFKIELDSNQEKDGLDRLNASIKEMDGLKIKQEMSRPRYTGELSFAVPAAVLAGNEKVAAFYPPDEEGWCWFPVKFEEERFTGLSRRASDKLLKEGQAYRTKMNEPKGGE